MSGWPGRKRVVRAVGRAVPAAVVMVVAWAILSMVGAELSLPLLVATGVAARLLWQALPGSAGSPIPLADPDDPGGPAVGGPVAGPTPAGADGRWRLTDEPVGDGLQRAVAGWARRLDWLSGDPVGFATTVQPRLMALVDRRLWLRHRIVRADEPQRTREVVGDRVWALLSAPVGRAPSPAQLAALIAEIEAL